MEEIAIIEMEIWHFFLYLFTASLMSMVIGIRTGRSREKQEAKLNKNHHQWKHVLATELDAGMMLAFMKDGTEVFGCIYSITPPDQHDLITVLVMGHQHAMYFTPAREVKVLVDESGTPLVIQSMQFAPQTNTPK